MKNNLKLTMALLTLSAVSFGICTSSIAANIPATPIMPAHPTAALRMIRPARPREMKMLRVQKTVRLMPSRRMPWHLGLRRNKHLTTNDARTITQAALLMRGRHDLNTGKIQTRKNRFGREMYIIQLVNQRNHIVSSVVMNSTTGHIRPLLENR